MLICWYYYYSENEYPTESHLQIQYHPIKVPRKYFTEIESTILYMETEKLRIVNSKQSTTTQTSNNNKKLLGTPLS